MFILNKEISTNTAPYIIAEISANHNGSIKRAKETIKAAYHAGASAVKIQTYTPDTMTIDCNKDDFLIKGGLWEGHSLYALYKKAFTPFEWHEELFKFASDIGITLFSSPFDESAVDLLESLNTPAYKIASFEMCDLPLIKYIAKTKKPILMSTGMASEIEIAEAVKTAEDNGCEDLLLFHCISSYPAELEEYNLKNIKFLQKRFGVKVGLSDHTIGNTAAIASIPLGACAIEKHFTLSRSEKGPDSEFSIEPKELISLVEQTQSVWKALGKDNFNRSKSEEENKIFRRSLYFVNNLKKGETITSNDIRRIRPGFGLPPKFLNEIVGKQVKNDVEFGDPVNWEIIS